MQDNHPAPKTPAEIKAHGASFKYSASQIAAQRDCFTKWYLDQTLNRPRRDTPATALGKKIHGELEGWLKNRLAPANPRAKALLPLLPLPSPDLKVEHEIRLLTPPGVVRGFMDLFILDPCKVQMPSDFGESPDVPVVTDHKTTSNIYYAKSSEDLLTDPQAVLYGLAARIEAKENLGSSPEYVDLAWNYVQTRGDPETKAVRLRQSLAIMEDGLGPIIEEAARMRSSLVSAVDPRDLPHDLSSCDKYNGCVFRDVCPHVSTARQPVQEEKMTESSSTLARLRNLAKAPRPEPAAETTAPPPDEPVAEISPEPRLSAVPVDNVGQAETPVAVLPPDAPQPAKRSKKAKAESSVSDPLIDLVDAMRKCAKDLVPHATSSKHFFAIGAILEYCDDFSPQAKKADSDPA